MTFWALRRLNGCKLKKDVKAVKAGEEMNERKKLVISSFLKILYPPFLYLAGLNIMACLIVLVFGKEAYLGHSMLVSLVTMIILTPVLYYSYQKDKIKQEDFFSGGKKAGVLVYLLTATLSFLLALGLNFLIAAIKLQEVFPEYSQTAERMFEENGMIVLLVTLVMAPVMEELIFRGLCYGRIRQFTGKGMTILLTALLFGLYHMNLVQFVYAAVMGAFFAFLYERYRDIRLTMTAHFAANLCAVVLSFSSLQL